MKNTIWVALSNGLVLISSIISGFIVPGILGVTEYGYYQTFTLYLVYTALLHFGFVDGVLLKYAGTEYAAIDKKKFNSITRFYVLTQGLASVILFIVALTLSDSRAKAIMLFIAVDTLFLNITIYYQYVSQSTMRFKELSIRRVLQACMKIFIVVLLYFLYRKEILRQITAYYYIGGICIVDCALALWYMLTYRDITFGERLDFASCMDEFKSLYRTGLMLTLAFQGAHLVFVLDRQFVVKLFDTDTYSIYAFAYSLISMITTVIGAVSIVLFPSMKQKKNEETVNCFDEWIALISIVVFASMCGYFVLHDILRWVVPKYENSLSYVRIVFPGLAVSCSISIIVLNFYKVFHKIALFMRIVVGVLVLGAALNLTAYQIFGTPSAISAASIVTLSVWFLLSQLYFMKEYGTSPWKNLLYMAVLSAAFWISTSPALGSLTGLGVYFLAFAGMTLLLHGKMLKRYLRKVKSH